MATIPDPTTLEPVRSGLERKIADGELEMPVLSTVVTQVIDMARSPDSSAAQLSDLIHGDQALAAHLLRLANSPLYLPSTQIVSLQQAISRLGMRVIGDLAIALAAKAVAFDVPGYESEVKDLWRRAAAAGAFAREIGRMRRRSAESALLCGLLQNVGFPILLQATRVICEELGEEIDREAAWKLADEYHSAVGSQMAESWGLPDSVVDAIHFHHEYGEAPEHGEDARVTILSDLLAAYLLEEAEPAPEPAADAEELEDPRLTALRSHEAFGELDLYPDDVDELLARSNEVKETMELFV